MKKHFPIIVLLLGFASIWDLRLVVCSLLGPITIAVSYIARAKGHSGLMITLGTIFASISVAVSIVNFIS